ncbi:MAG: 30S ribosome-binding factor RbfA [Pseudomonadota bacterium]
MRPPSNTEDRSQRQLRVGEELKHVMCETLQKGRFHDILLMDAASTVTVTEVRASPDLKHATAYIVALGGRNMDDLLPALNDAAAVFQKDIGRKMRLKFTPRVYFKADETFDNAERITHLLHQIDQ